MEERRRVMPKRNVSIDLFRYACAIMVVAIHTDPFYDIDVYLGYLFTQILSRIVVPFFFITSGYFYRKTVHKSWTAIKSYFKKIIGVYLAWSIIYYAIDFLTWGHQNLKGYIAHCIFSFFITGSHYHFWFFPALIISALIITFLCKTGLRRTIIPLCMVLYAIGCLGCSYRALGDIVPGLNRLYRSESFLTIRRIFLMGLPFFGAGFLVDWIKDFFIKKRWNTAIQLLLLCGIFVIWIFEILIISMLGLKDNLVQTIGLFPLVVGLLVFFLLHPGRNEKLAASFHMAADWTYYVHPILILVLQSIAEIHQWKIEHTWLFLWVLLFVWPVIFTWRWVKTRIITIEQCRQSLG